MCQNIEKPVFVEFRQANKKFRQIYSVRRFTVYSSYFAIREFIISVYKFIINLYILKK